MRLKQILFIIFFSGLALSMKDVSFASMSVFNVIGFSLLGLSALFLVSFMFYLYKKEKNRNLVLLFLFFVFSALSVPAFADPMTAKESVLFNQELNVIESQYAPQVCAAANEGHEYDEKILEQAYKIADFYSKYVAAGKTPTGFDGDSISTSYDCAQRYIEFASDLEKQETTSCSPLSMLVTGLLTKDDCWPCDITALVITSIGELSTAAHGVVNSAAKALLGAIFLLWLGMTVLISFAKFGFEKFAEFFTKLLHQAILVTIIAVILHFPLATFYRIVVSPAVGITTGLAITITDMAKDAIGAKQSLIMRIAGHMSFMDSSIADCSYCDSIRGKSSDSGFFSKAFSFVSSLGMSGSSNLTYGSQFLDEQSTNSIMCVVCTTYRSLAPMVSLGQTMMCVAQAAPRALSQINALSSLSLFSMPNIPLMAMGALIVLLFTVVMFIVGYFMMTATLKMGVALVLMPLFIMAYAFKFSRPYANKCWGLIFHSLVTILVTTMAISLLMIGFNNLLPQTMFASLVSLFTSGSPDQILGLATLSPPMGTSGISDMADNVMKSVTTGGASIAILHMVAFAYISLHIIAGASDLAERLTNQWMQLGEYSIMGGAVSNAFSSGSKGLSATTKAVAGGSYVAGKWVANKAKSRTSNVKQKALNELNQSRARWSRAYDEENKPKPSPSPTPTPTSTPTPTPTPTPSGGS